MAEWKLDLVEKETEGNCWHCGAAIKWVCWISNKDDGQQLAVGRTCCANFLSRKDCKLADCYVDYAKLAIKLQKRAEKFGWDEKTFATQLRMHTTVPYVTTHYPALAKYF